MAKLLRPVVFFLFLFALAGCGQAKSEAVSAVERYYLAIVQQNPDALAAVVCSDFEKQAKTELDSFQGVKITLDQFSCSDAGKDGDSQLVTCAGKIVASYANEKMDFPLEGRSHKVIQQSGYWLVCGY